MSNPLVSIIVLNWNGKEVIEKCLESLQAQNYPHKEIIIIDNGSSDGSYESLIQNYPTHKLIRNERNLGFAAGVNQGIRAAHGDYIALLNSDAYADAEWLTHSVKAATEKDNIAMVASKIYLEGRDNVLDNTGLVLGHDAQNRTRGRLEADKGQYDQSIKVLCPSGCAALYRKEALEEIGLMDEKMFAYGEDLETGLRLRLLGYEAVFAPNAKVYHKLSHSTEAASAIKAYYVERNRLWVLIKCFPLPQLLFSVFYTIQRYFYLIWGMLVKKGPSHEFTKSNSPLQLLWLLLKGYGSTLGNLPHLLSQRSRILSQAKAKHEFKDWLRDYGVSAKDAALSPIRDSS